MDPLVSRLAGVARKAVRLIYVPDKKHGDHRGKVRQLLYF